MYVWQLRVFANIFDIFRYLFFNFSTYTIIVIVPFLKVPTHM